MAQHTGSSPNHQQAMMDGRFRAGYTEERPRKAQYKALGCSGCNRPFGAGHDDWCKALDPDPNPRPAGPIAPRLRPGEQLCTGPCGQVLPANASHFQRSHSGGFWRICKACNAERARLGIARKRAQGGEGVA